MLSQHDLDEVPKKPLFLKHAWLSQSTGDALNGRWDCDQVTVKQSQSGLFDHYQAAFF